MSTPDGLFDTIINRADGFLRISRPTNRLDALQEWHARTRFARRVSFDDLVHILEGRPEGQYHWEGGLQGAWIEGEPRFP
ncbi:hypothetical protein [Deinococcus cellulosilyticus]|uniref:Uncharacterized protein n=1 Tax=Deinococcus cellulosilyticus (strain DSM 18568 / NBRC 106333 / KACC 11606 / 5516J-15) TaxID=1223518 RepID=A0A511N5X0_DEIC1|nr:hypothetical protein [Deinococcus cellulosilyticus]GEM48234.1 hypothetical protein DC3_38690 [Deinococcus cellulosilyticus NBRC 106333 = KACC 11606]